MDLTPSDLTRPMDLTPTVHERHRREHLADALVHAVGVVAALIGFAVLIGLALAHGAAAQIASVAVYGAALVAMLVCSALYNAARGSARGELLRRVDHAAIFVMIAATYTPFLVVKIGGSLGHGLLAFIWSAAAAGVGLKLLAPRRLERLSLALYLALGWTVLVAMEPLTSSVSEVGVSLLLAGGVLYTVGVIFYVWDALPYQRAIWHGFVLAAAACHYAAVLGDVALAGMAT